MGIKSVYEENFLSRAPDEAQFTVRTKLKEPWSPARPTAPCPGGEAKTHRGSISSKLFRQHWSVTLDGGLLEAGHEMELGAPAIS